MSGDVYHRLIQLVKPYRMIYDSKVPCNRSFKARIWQTIAESLGESVTATKKLWTNIRKRHRKSMKTKTIFKYSRELQFLDTYVDPVDPDVICLSDNDEDDPLYNTLTENSPGAEPDSQSSEEDSDTDSIANKIKNYIKKNAGVVSTTSDTSPPNRAPERSPQTSSKPAAAQNTSKPAAGVKRKRAQSLPDTSGYQEILMFIKESKEKERTEEDPLASFFNTVHGTVKKFTPYYQNVAKHRIFSLVSELEMQQITEQAPTEMDLPESSDIKMVSEVSYHLMD